MEHVRLCTTFVRVSYSQPRPRTRMSYSVHVVLLSIFLVIMDECHASCSSHDAAAVWCIDCFSVLTDESDEGRGNRAWRGRVHGRSGRMPMGGARATCRISRPADERGGDKHCARFDTFATPSGAPLPLSKSPRDTE